MDDSVLLAPALALGDVYIYAHGNGAVSVLQAGSDHDVVTLATALTMARTSHDAGHDVWVGGDDQPLAVDSLTAIGTLGIHPEAFAAPAPPFVWTGGTTALMEAAAKGRSDLVRDLTARGASVHERDESGSTALHHAAVEGRADCVRALIDAGADVNAVNHKGHSPVLMAQVKGFTEIAGMLAGGGGRAVPVVSGLPGDPAGNPIRRLQQKVWQWVLDKHGSPYDPGPAAATGAAGPSKRLTFSTEHLWVSYPWMAISAIWVGLTIALHAVGEWTGWELLIPVVPLLVTWVMLNPPWAMPVPRSLLGRDLTYRTLFGRSKTLDLGEVSVAGLSGARLVTQQTRFIVLGHPSGKALTWRQRRRVVMEPDDFAELLEAAPDGRFVCLAVLGKDTDTVIRSVRDVLAGTGATLTRSMWT